MPWLKWCFTGAFFVRFADQYGRVSSRRGSRRGDEKAARMPSLLRPALLTFSAFLLAESLFGTLPAQGNWGRYRPGTITAIVELHDSTIRATPTNLLPTWVLPGNQFPTRAQVTYRGDSHPIDSTRREIVRRWGLSYLRDSSIAATYHREYLFQEGRYALWLPVQDKVASFFPRELQSGQTVTLYVLWLGAHYAGGDVTWAFVVTEFDTDTTKR